MPSGLLHLWTPVVLPFVLLNQKYPESRIPEADPDFHTCPPLNFSHVISDSSTRSTSGKAGVAFLNYALQNKNKAYFSASDCPRKAGFCSGQKEECQARILSSEREHYGQEHVRHLQSRPSHACVYHTPRPGQSPEL